VPDRPIAAYVALVAMSAVLGLLWLRARDDDAPAPTPIRLTQQGQSGSGERGGRLVVHVAGAVRHPGVLHLRPGARVDDAVRRAGGPTRRADLSAVNLAAKVEDGRQVLVPERPRGAGVAGVAAPEAIGPLNLNTATPEQLDELDGIGPGMAQRILDYREEQGGFGSIEELSRVPGIGEKRMAALREAVTL
jgi:competence protein ComEA